VYGESTTQKKRLVALRSHPSAVCPQPVAQIASAAVEPRREPWAITHAWVALSESAAGSATVQSSPRKAFRAGSVSFCHLLVRIEAGRHLHNGVSVDRAAAGWAGLGGQTYRAAGVRSQIERSAAPLSTFLHPRPSHAVTAALACVPPWRTHPLLLPDVPTVPAWAWCWRALIDLPHSSKFGPRFGSRNQGRHRVRQLECLLDSSGQPVVSLHSGGSGKPPVSLLPSRPTLSIPFTCRHP